MATENSGKGASTEHQANAAYIHFQFFRFTGWNNRWWAFKQMRLAPPLLKQQPGLTFAKMLGSGGGEGFSAWPDWGTYALLSVWRDQADHHRFQRGALAREFEERSSESFQAVLQPILARGSWNNQQPFGPTTDKSTTLMAVLTRASIRRRQMLRFWRYVPGVSRRLFDQPGLLFAKGVGEWPLVEQATFSLWRSAEAMQAFAYQGKRHAEVIAETRRRDWYSEEMFARFAVLSLHGQWRGEIFNTGSAEGF